MILKAISGLLAILLMRRRADRADGHADLISDLDDIKVLGISCVGPLDRGTLMRAFAEIEGQDMRVERVFMNSRDYLEIQPDIRKYVPTMIRESGFAFRFRGADIIVSNSVTAGTVYVCADEAAMGLSRSAAGCFVSNPHAVVMIDTIPLVDRSIPSAGASCTYDAHRKRPLTCNQLMVLLDIYRGTFHRSRHMATVTGDISHLLRRGLITGSLAEKASCTDDGTALVKRMRDGSY